MNGSKNTERKVHDGKRKLYSILSVILTLIIAGLVTAFVWKWMASFSQDSFRDYIRSFGALGWVVLLGLQILQVFVALIPGELLESAAGYSFGPIMGTVLCYLGVAIGSAIIFFLTRRFGIKLVEVFVEKDRINNLRFINTEKKRDLLVFIFYFIPGTPKDLFTYFVGLTNIRFSTFIIISLVARFPSVISSTFGGHLIGEGNYLGAFILYSVTGLLSVIGLIVYNLIIYGRNKSTDAKESEQCNE